jgi:hypothetical protein
MTNWLERTDPIEIFLYKEKKLMKLTLKEYLEETKAPAPRYQDPLPRKRQRVMARGRSGKPRIWTEEEIFLYQLRQASKEIEWEV